MNQDKKSVYLRIIFVAAAVMVLIWSGISPKDRVTWILEVFPAAAGLVLIFFSYRKFPLTDLLFVLIMLHCMVLCLGGKYTYAEVPLGYWFQELAGFSRNPYDRLGHLFQGFVPAILAREILIRKSPVKEKAWLFLFVTSICLAFSALYELIEWAVAIISGQGATAFLGTQGDVWDTQWDMFLCLLGALASQLLLSAWHDRQLKKLLSKT